MAVKTTKITIETEGLLVVRSARTVTTWCPDCQAEVEVMLLEQDNPLAELLAGLPTGRLHTWSTPEGTRICLPSLSLRSKSNDVQQIQIPERTLAKKEKDNDAD